MKIAVIAGRIFGITTAFTLGEEYDVELFEKNNDLLKAASGSNQFRVHRGYHYPRSMETVLEIMKSENSFKEIFSEVTVSHYDHYYCIAKNWIMKWWWFGMAVTVALVYTGFVYLVPWH